MNPSLESAFFATTRIISEAAEAQVWDAATSLRRIVRCSSTKEVRATQYDFFKSTRARQAEVLRKMRDAWGQKAQTEA